jgi:hypothetical protein
VRRYPHENRQPVKYSEPPIRQQIKRFAGPHIDVVVIVSDHRHRY